MFLCCHFSSHWSGSESHRLSFTHAAAAAPQPKPLFLHSFAWSTLLISSVFDPEMALHSSVGVSVLAPQILQDKVQIS